MTKISYISAGTIIYKLTYKCLLRAPYDLIRIRIKLKALSFFLAELCHFPGRWNFIVHFCGPNHCHKMETCTLTYRGPALSNTQI